MKRSIKKFPFRKFKVRRAAKLRSKFGIVISAPVNLLLKNGLITPAVILLCCGIDYLAKYYSGETENHFNKSKYIIFLKKYFPKYNNPEDFYSFVRCGLIHSFSMNEQYLISKNKISVGEHMSKKRIGSNEITIINPWVLKGNFRAALRKYMSDIETSNVLYSNFLQVFEKYKLKQPTIDIRSKRNV